MLPVNPVFDLGDCLPGRSVVTTEVDGEIPLSVVARAGLLQSVPPQLFAGFAGRPCAGGVGGRINRCPRRLTLIRVGLCRRGTVRQRFGRDWIELVDEMRGRPPAQRAQDVSFFLNQELAASKRESEFTFFLGVNLAQIANQAAQHGIAVLVHGHLAPMLQT